MAENDIVLNVAYQSNTAQLLSEVEKANRSAQSLLKPIKTNVDFSNLTKGVGDAKNQFNQLTEASVDFGDSLERGLRRITALSAASVALFGIVKLFQESIKASRELEKSLQNINVVLNLPSGQLKQFSKDLFDVARNTNQTFDEVAKSATEFSRQGLSAEETLKRTQAALILVNLAGINAVQATEAITAAVNSFSKENLKAIDVVNKLVAVDGQFAVSSADLAEAISRVGSTSQDAGVGLNSLIALVTATQQITQRGGSVIGNAFKNIFQRLRREDVLNSLEEMGIQVRDIEAATGSYTGKLLSADKVLSQLSERFKTLNDEQRSQTSEMVAGALQGNIFRGVMASMAIQQEAYQTALKASDEAIRRNAALLETQDSKIKRLGTTLQQAGANIANVGLGDFINKSLSGLNTGEGGSIGANIGGNIIQGLSGTLKGKTGDTFSQAAADVGNSFGTVFIKTISDIILGPGLVTIGLIGIKIADQLRKFTTNITKQVNPFSKQDITVQQQIDSFLQKQLVAVQAILASTSNKALQEQRILELFQQQNLVLAEQGRLRQTANTILIRGTSSGKLPNFAEGGVVDALGREQKAISRGVGGASSSAKPVYIPNVSVGGSDGIVANTDEFFVSNYNGGKFAIFNQDAVAKNGLPQNAQRITTGFVPNFADLPQKAGFYFPEDSGYSSVKDKNTRAFTLRNEFFKRGVSDAFEADLVSLIRKNSGVFKQIAKENTKLLLRVSGKSIRNRAEGYIPNFADVVVSGFRNGEPVIQTRNPVTGRFSSKTKELEDSISLVGSKGVAAIISAYGGKVDDRTLKQLATVTAQQLESKNTGDLLKFPTNPLVGADIPSPTPLPFGERGLPPQEIIKPRIGQKFSDVPLEAPTPRNSPSFIPNLQVPSPIEFGQRGLGRQEIVKQPISQKFSDFKLSPPPIDAEAQRSTRDANLFNKIYSNRQQGGELALISDSLKSKIEVYRSALDKNAKILNDSSATDKERASANFKVTKSLKVLNDSLSESRTLGGQQSFQQLFNSRAVTPELKQQLSSIRGAPVSDIESIRKLNTVQRLAAPEESRLSQLEEVNAKIAEKQAARSQKLDGTSNFTRSLNQSVESLRNPFLKLEKALLESKLSISPQKVERIANAGFLASIALPFATEGISNYATSNISDDVTKGRVQRGFSTAGQGLSTAGFVASLAPTFGAAAPVALGAAGLIAAGSIYRGYNEGSTDTSEDTRKRFENIANTAEQRKQTIQVAQLSVLKLQDVINAGGTPEQFASAIKDVLETSRGTSSGRVRQAARDIAFSRSASPKQIEEFNRIASEESTLINRQTTANPANRDTLLKELREKTTDKNAGFFSRLLVGSSSGAVGVEPELQKQISNVESARILALPKEKRDAEIADLRERQSRAKSVIEAKPSAPYISDSFQRFGLLALKGVIEGGRGTISPENSLLDNQTAIRNRAGERQQLAGRIRNVLGSEANAPETQKALEAFSNLTATTQEVQDSFNYLREKVKISALSLENIDDEFKKGIEAEQNYIKSLDIRRESLNKINQFDISNLKSISQQKLQAGRGQIAREQQIDIGRIFGVQSDILEQRKLSNQSVDVGAQGKIQEREQASEFSKQFNNLILQNRTDVRGSLKLSDTGVTEQLINASSTDEFTQKINAFNALLDRSDSSGTGAIKKLRDDIVSLENAAKLSALTIEKQVSSEKNLIELRKRGIQEQFRLGGEKFRRDLFSEPEKFKAEQSNLTSQLTGGNSFQRANDSSLSSSSRLSAAGDLVERINKIKDDLEKNGISIPVNLEEQINKEKGVFQTLSKDALKTQITDLLNSQSSKSTLSPVESQLLQLKLNALGGGGNVVNPYTREVGPQNLNAPTFNPYTGQLGGNKNVRFNPYTGRTEDSSLGEAYFDPLTGSLQRRAPAVKTEKIENGRSVPIEPQSKILDKINEQLNTNLQGLDKTLTVNSDSMTKLAGSLDGLKDLTLQAQGQILLTLDNDSRQFLKDNSTASELANLLNARIDEVSIQLSQLKQEVRTGNKTPPVAIPA